MTGDLVDLVEQAQHWAAKHWPAVATGAFFGGILGILWWLGPDPQADQTSDLRSLDSPEGQTTD